MRVSHRTLVLSLVVLAFCLLGADCTRTPIDGLSVPVSTAPSPARYGALGNSLTAGFINNGLIRGGQEASYPNWIAREAGWDPLQHPIIAEPGIGPPDASGIPQSALFIDQGGSITSVPVDPFALLRNATLPVPYDNLGVPGATTADLLNARDAATSQAGNNAFFDLILRNSQLPPRTWTALDQMTARNPIALTLWVGSNDVLGGATGGDPVVGVNITPPQVFEGLWIGVAQRIQAMQASIVAVGNVPDVTVIPFVRTVPLGVETPIGFVRWQMEEDLDQDGDDVEFVLLTAPVRDPSVAPSYLPPPVGSGENTLPSRYTLTAAEVQTIAGVVSDYNTVIAREAAARGWALADINSELAALPSDPTNPDNFSVPNAIFPWLPNPLAPGSFFQNQLSGFSLDGVHPSELGQGIVANAFIAALNTTYGLEIPSVDLDTIRNTIGFPSGLIGGRRRGATPLFDAGGERALEAMVAMFGANAFARP